MPKMTQPTVSRLSFLRGSIAEIINTPLYRNAYALAFNTLSTSGLGILYWILAARFYDSETVGLSSAAISTMMFVSSLAQLNLSDALGRFLPNTGNKTRQFILSAYGITVLLALIVASVFAVVYLYLSGNGGFLLGSISFAIGFVIAVMMWTVFHLQDSALTGLRRATVVPVENTLFGVVKIVLLVAFALIFPLRGIFASWVIPVVLSLIPINFLIFRYFIPHHVKTYQNNAKPITFQSLRKFVVGNYIGSLFYQAFITLPPLVVVSMLGPEANAVFYIPWLIGNSFDLIPKDMTQSLTVEGALDEEKLPDLAFKMLGHMLAILLPLAIVTAIGAPFILRIFGANYAAEGSLLLQLLAISVVMRAISFLYMGICRVRENIRGILTVQIMLCIGILGMGILLLPTYGIIAFGITWVISQLIVSIYALYQLRDIINIHTLTKQLKEVMGKSTSPSTLSPDMAPPTN